MNDAWRGSEVQVVAPATWTRLNGTNTEILIPDATETTLIRVRPAGGQE